MSIQYTVRGFELTTFGTGSRPSKDNLGHFSFYCLNAILVQNTPQNVFKSRKMEYMEEASSSFFTHFKTEHQIHWRLLIVTMLRPYKASK